MASWKPSGSAATRMFLRRLVVLRAIDKLDRLGVEGVRLLLGPGRKDESGDFTKGAGLSGEQIATIFAFLQARTGTIPADAAKALRVASCLVFHSPQVKLIKHYKTRRFNRG